MIEASKTGQNNETTYDSNTYFKSEAKQESENTMNKWSLGGKRHKFG